jgi:TRAP-type C4-dicarboxylate transport system substrate-binding protein
MRSKLLGCVASLAALLAIPSAGSAAEYRLLSSWDGRYLGTTIIADRFAAEVKKATNGRVSISRVGPEAVPVLEQLQPASAGAFHFLFTHGGYHAGSTGIALALDSIAPDPAARRAAGLWDFVDAHYSKRNLKVIALPVAGSQGYQIFLRKPLTPDNLKGLKVRGTTVYHNLIKELGGAPVVLPGGEIYPSLDKGVIDGAAWAMIGGHAFRWYEVAKYVARPTFGVSTHLLFMNLDAWKKLSPEDQKIVLAEGSRIEVEAIATFDKEIANELAELKKQGVQETNFSASKEQLESLWNQGLWQVALSGPARADAEQMRKLASEKKLTR